MDKEEAKEKVKEAEANNGQNPEVAEAVATVINEAVKFFDVLGKAVITAAQDISNLMVIKVDGDTRKHLDLLVDAGVATSRRDAAATLLDAGIGAKQTTFDRIQQTQAQIHELRQQIRTLVDARPA